MANEPKRNINLTMFQICSHFEDDGHYNDIILYLNLKNSSAFNN